MRLVSIASVALAAGCAAPRPAPHRPRLAATTTTTTTVAAPLPTAPATLPDRVAPTAYRLELTIDPEADTYRGAIEIDLAVATARDTLWWHATADLTLTAVTVRRGATDVAIRALIPTAIGGDIAGAALAAPLPAGPATLRIEFTAPMRDVAGVFRNPTPDGPFVFTDLEPEDARSAFPCFDEPRWRAPLTLTLTTPDRFAAYANMPEDTATREGDWVVHRFAPTPPLPTYLYGFAVGAFTVVAIPDAPIPTRLLAPPSVASLDHARGQLAGLIDASARFLGRPWPWPKLDVVVVPSLVGAMENPGLITIAADIAHDAINPAARARVELVLAHELAHAWFGTWVTPRDWRELWLNEGLATWMADRVLRERGHGLRHASDRVVDRQPVLALDGHAPRALRPAQPMAPRALFDLVTYQKGAAVARALEAWLGPTVLAAGLGRYLDDRAWSTATTDDLAAALTTVADDQPVAAVLRAAVEGVGAPRIAVERTCGGGGASLRLRGDGRDRPTPICVRWDGASPGRGCAVVTDVATIAVGPACPTWFTVEPDSYARWRLEPDAWAALATAPLPGDARLAALDAALDAVADGHAGAAAIIATAEGALAEADPAVAMAAVDALRLVAAAGDAPTRAAAAAAAERALARGGRRASTDRTRIAVRLEAEALIGAHGGDRRRLAAAVRTVAAWRRGAATPVQLLGPALVTVAARGTARQRAQVRAAAFRDTGPSREVGVWLARALRHEPDAVALATGTAHVPIGAVQRPLRLILLEDPAIAEAVIAALPAATAEELVARTPVPCAAPAAASSSPDQGRALTAAAVARCRAIAANLRAPTPRAQR